MINFYKNYCKYLLLAFMALPHVVQAMQLPNTSHSTDNFDPESAIFSQMKTLKTWVSKEHTQDEAFMKTFQRNVAMEVPENPFSYHLCCRPIVNNPGDPRYYGKSFQIIRHPVLSFLKYVHNISAKPGVNVLEIAASIGLVSWMIPYSFQKPGRLYVNELSSQMLKLFGHLCDQRFQGKEALHQCITTLPNSCFNILTEHPELKGTFGAIYSGNLDHFFNPLEHQRYLELLVDLLAEDGRAFLVAHTFAPDEAAPDHPTQVLYKKSRESGIPYPGFHQATITAEMLIQSQAPLPGAQVSDVLRPKDTDVCGYTLISQSTPEMAWVEPYGLQKIGKTKQVVITNAFTQEVYRDAIRRHPSARVKESLEILDSFYLDNKGNNYSKFEAGKGIIHVGVVLRKKHLAQPAGAQSEQAAAASSSSSTQPSTPSLYPTPENLTTSIASLNLKP